MLRASRTRIRIQTGMAPGRYRDAIQGTTIRVNASGMVTVVVGARDAVAFDRTDRT